MIQTEELYQRVKQLLETSGFRSDYIEFLPCAKGGNNRTFRLETADHTFALKEYFRQSADKRDRLASEYAFLTYANRVAPGMAPLPYAQDPEAGLALYEFIEGKPIFVEELTEADIDAAAAFFCALNQPELKLQADLPNASEACFSINEHIELVGARITTLQAIIPENDQDHLAAERIKSLNKHWEIISRDVKNAAQSDGIALANALEIDQRCISPSDFGFHNALRTTDGRIRFLDFEYAGWDDPAKMVGDFFSQLAVPVPAHYFHRFTEAVMKPFYNSAELVQRATLMRYVYHIKWCCIALNVFIPVNLERRKFANPDLNIIELKAAQLIKAESLLQHLELNYV